MTHLPPVPPAIVQPAVPVAPVRLNLESASVPDLVRALCQVTGHPRYALAPDVVMNARKVTLALDGPPDDVWSDGVAALNMAGVQAKCLKGLCQFSELVVVPPVKPETEKPQAVLSYVPVHRNVAFLASSLSSMFTGWHFAGSGSSASGAASQEVSAAVSPASGSGGSGPASGHATPAQAVPARLVGIGPALDRARILQVLAEVDQPVPSMVVHLAVYEVDTSAVDQSAINLVAGVLGQSVTVGGSVNSLSASSLATVSVKFGGFQAVVAALDSTSFAHLITQPVLRTSSGVMSSFAVGDSVPTLGSVSYSSGSSTPVQSITYQQSGVVFSVIPELVGQLVDVALYQSISSFTATTVGVTSSPTLQNRALSSDLIVQPGSVVLLGGLMQSNDTKGTSGWWIAPKLSHSNTRSKSDLVLVLSVDVDPAR